MKKFAFSNEKYQGIKEKEYERLKLDMGNVDKEIDTVTAALAELGAQFDAERTVFAAACKQGVGTGELQNYQGFFEFLQEKRAAGKDKLEALLARKRALAESLARLHNELKVLEEMRAEEYQAYLKEAAAEEAKELDAHISFSVFERAV